MITYGFHTSIVPVCVTNRLEINEMIPRYAAVISSLLFIPAFAFAATPRLGNPDTYIVTIDVLGNVLDLDDNSSKLGDGLASGISSLEDSFIDNGNGTRSIRTVVTGSPDGSDLFADGFFANSPHGQLGGFMVHVEYFDPGDTLVGTDEYSAEFISGSEAFHINFDVPNAAFDASIHIDNQLIEACDEPADINGDGVVDTADLGILIGMFGFVCPL